MTLALALATSLAAAQPAPPAPPTVPDAPAAPAPPRLPTVAQMDQYVSVDLPTNDVFAMGQSVSVTADVGDNAFVMAQTLDVTSPVHGDLFAMGEAVTIDAPVGGDLYAMGARVVVTANGSVGGDVHGAAEVFTVRGPVGGDLQLGAGRLELEAPVGGDAELQLGEVVVGASGAIAGSLDYAAVQPMPGLEGVTAGSIDFTEEAVEVDDHEVAATDRDDSSLLAQAAWWASMRVWGFVTKLMVGAALFLVAGGRLAAVGRRITTHPGHSLGVGFLVACVLPVASTLALAMVVPFPLGLLGFTVLAIALYVAQLFAAQALGDLVLQRFRPEAVGSPVLSMAVGLVPLVVLCAIPWFGGLAWFAATFLGMGAAWSVLRGAA